MKQSWKDLLRRIHRFFKSLKLTAVVIALLTLMYFLGLVLPQKWMFDSKELYELWIDESFVNRILDWTGFTEIYLSPLTIFLLGLFFINLLVVTVNRIPVIMKRSYLAEGLASFSPSDLKKAPSVRKLNPQIDSERLVQRLKEYFRKQRWFFTRGKEESTFVAVKNRFSPFGFLFFHFSFFLCLIGGLMIAYTRFSGNLPLTEGQSFEGDIRQFRVVRKEPKILKTMPSLSLLLEKVEPRYENDVPTELVVTLKVKYNEDVRREVLRVNEPINRGALSIIAEQIGVSPLFVVRGPGGQEIDGAYVSLNVLDGQEDSFQFDTDKRYKFFVRFYPDHVVKDGKDASKSIELKNPAIHLDIEKEMKKVYEGTIGMGDKANMGIYTVSFEDVRYWAEFMIVREYGKLPLIIGFALAAVGLIMRLVFFQKRLRLAIEEDNSQPVLYIDGRSEYFQHSFKDELNRTVNHLDEYLRSSEA